MGHRRMGPKEAMIKSSTPLWIFITCAVCALSLPVQSVASKGLQPWSTCSQPFGQQFELDQTPVQSRFNSSSSNEGHLVGQSWNAAEILAAIRRSYHSTIAAVGSQSLQIGKMGEIELPLEIPAGVEVLLMSLPSLLNNHRFHRDSHFSDIAEWESEKHVDFVISRSAIAIAVYTATQDRSLLPQLLESLKKAQVSYAESRTPN